MSDNINSNKRHSRIILKLIFAAALFCAFFWCAKVNLFAQQTARQDSAQEKQKSQKSPKTQGSATGLSLTKVDQDKGYSIVAIRRVKHTYRSILNKIATDRTVMEVVIEMRVPTMPYNPMVTDMYFIYSFLIGDEAFFDNQACPSGKEHCIELFLTPDEFKRVRNNSIVNFYVGNPKEQLKEMYKDGEPKEVFGIKFGRLKKKMINRFPIVEMPVVRAD